MATMGVGLGGWFGGAAAVIAVPPACRGDIGGTPLPLEAILGIVAFAGLFVMWAVIPARLRKR